MPTERATPEQVEQCVDGLLTRIRQLEGDVARYREALEPFAHLAEVMQEGQYLNHAGVYISWADTWMAYEVLKGTDDA